MLTVLATGMSGVGAGAGVIFESETKAVLLFIFSASGWTVLTAVNLMLFSLVHNPCTTTIYTIHKETNSRKRTAIATLRPLALGFVLSFLLAQVWRLIAGLI